MLGLIAIACVIAGGLTWKHIRQRCWWDKTFAKSELVEVRKVSFKNRYGIKLVGDLYMPKTRDGKPMSAIAVAGPFGAVKEQASGLYAMKLAEAGFVTLAFDPSYTGESGGSPRAVASPEINTEDFSAAVDFLSLQPEVDAEKIGVVGICGFGGFALNAAAADTRIKATVTATMYDMTRVSARGYFDAMDEVQRQQLLRGLNAQRTEDAKRGKYAKDSGLPEKLSGDEPQFVKDYYDYYKTQRGFHKRSINSNGAWNKTTKLALINMPILAFAGSITTPVLLIHGKDAHSLYFSQDAYKKLKGKNKKLLVVRRANHTDLYDNLEKIPFAEMVEFFKAM
ncbi:MAG: alpha/beta hydrolase [Alphaproteobacteria bacterium]|nr:alpha/beta hydrolase [Alphaproteobacteria bacterium]